MCMLFLSGCTIRLSRPSGVYALSKTEIGGMDQWYLARSQEEELPVLLWVHGGPGAAQMPAWRKNKDLETEFIVVHWDQRGSGKSNPRNFDESSMTLERFISDVIGMTNYLRDKYNQEKIYILGHSWGTYIGLEAVLREPDYYKAYIGVSQLVDGAAANLIAYEELVERINGSGRRGRRDMRKLESLSGPPYPDMNDYMTFIRLLDKYDMALEVSRAGVVLSALTSGVYSLFDMVNWLRAWGRQAGPMWDEIWNDDVDDIRRNIKVPTFFITGSEDYVAPSELVFELMEHLGVPEENLYIMVGAAHFPFLADSDRYFEILQSIKNKVEEGE